MIPVRRKYGPAPRQMGRAVRMAISALTVPLAFAPISSRARAEVTVAATFPANGERAVDSRVNTLRIRFSEPIQRESFSLVNIVGAQSPEFVQPLRYRYEDGDRVLLVSIRLKPATRYAVGVNSEEFRNFRAAAPPQESVTPYILRFTTAPAPKKAPPRKPAPPKTPNRASATRAEHWRNDIDYLATELPKRHINLFDRLPRNEFARRVRELRRNVATLDDDSVVAGLARIVSAAGDAHTALDIWQNTRPRVLPVQLRPFRDGWFVVAATPENARLLGGRVVKLGGAEIEEACRRLAPYIPHDNASGLRNSLSTYLTHAGLLRAVGLIPDTHRVRLTIQSSDAVAVDADVATSTPFEMMGARIVPWIDPSGTSAPVSMRFRTRAYAVEPLQGGRVLYFAYNRCAQDADTPLPAFLAGLEERLRQPEVDRLVIDLRANGGGNSALLDPFIDALKGNARINRRNHLYVLIGPATFSSAVLNAVRLKTETNAILIGEPAGGRPGHYGEARFMFLPRSGLMVTYSTKKFAFPGLDGDSLEPDIRVQATSREFAAGQDPVLQAAVDA